MINQHGTLEISGGRLAHNLAVLRRRVGEGVKLCATIKANAYGHGVDVMAPLLLAEGVRWACVYTLEEAARITGLNWEGILVLAPLVLIDDVSEADEELFLRTLAGHVRVNLTDAASARRLATFAQGVFKEPINVHVQVDAGLTRAGIEPAEAVELAALIAQLPGLRLEGVFAHFSHGDVPGHATVEQQLTVLNQVAAPLRERFPNLMVHVQNSGGAWHMRPGGGLGLDMVRVGIALYGLQPSVGDPIVDLLPIARMTAPIMALHRRAAGTGIGYGHTFITQRQSVLAVVPVGYAEGFPRLMTNRCVVQVCGIDVPVVGRVSMDQIIVDVTDVPGAKIGEEATVISWDGAHGNSLDRMATAMGTIGYELATHLGGRLRRVVVE